jgi:predicted RNA-binding protein with RPS1 domain
VVKAGDEVEAVVLGVQTKERRISLGIKQLEADPWTTVESRYSIGSVVEGRVRKLTDFGAFIEIEEGIDGLVHVSDLSWTKRVKNPAEVLKKGQTVQPPSEQRRHPASRWESGNCCRCLGDVLPLASSGGRCSRAGMQTRQLWGVRRTGAGD